MGQAEARAPNWLNHYMLYVVQGKTDTYLFDRMFFSGVCNFLDITAHFWIFFMLLRAIYVFPGVYFLFFGPG